MPQERYTLDEYATMMRTNKPYLMALEDMVNETDFGEVEVILDVRAKVVEKMTAVSKKIWLRPKEGHNRAGFQTVVVEASASALNK